MSEYRKTYEGGLFFITLTIVAAIVGEQTPTTHV